MQTGERGSDVKKSGEMQEVSKAEENWSASSLSKWQSVLGGMDSG